MTTIESLTVRTFPDDRLADFLLVRADRSGLTVRVRVIESPGAMLPTVTQAPLARAERGIRGQIRTPEAATSPGLETRIGIFVGFPDLALIAARGEAMARLAGRD